MRALASTIRRAASTLTIGSGAVSSTRAWSSASLRDAMSRMMPPKKRPSAVSHVESESSIGNSAPSARRPTTSTVLPMMRDDSGRSATRCRPASCIGRKRSGIRNDSGWPITRSRSKPNMRSAAGLQETIRPSESAAMMASLADSATERKRLSDSRSACSIRMPAIRRPTWRPMCEATSSSRSSGLTASIEKHSITAKVAPAIGIGNEKPPRSPTEAA